MSLPGWLRPVDGGVVITIWAQPRAARTRVAGLHGDALKLQLAAPPVDGEANAELRKFLAKTLGTPKAAVTLLRGETGRSKQVKAEGVSVEQAQTRLTP